MRNLMVALALALGAGACASTAGVTRAAKPDPGAAAAVGGSEEVHACLLMERERDPHFRGTQARLHVRAGGVVESVAVDDRPYLGECIARALRSHTLELEANDPKEDYVVAVTP